MCSNVPGADDVFEEKHAGAYHLFGGGLIHKMHFMFQILKTHVRMTKSRTPSLQIHTIVYHMTT